MPSKFSALIFLLISLMLAPDVLAHGAIWTSKNIVVRDYSGSDWQPLVREQVMAFNRMLPKKAPKLIYKRKTEQPCARVKSKPETIAVCMGSLNQASRITKGNELRRAKVSLWDKEWPEYRQNAICHELMHAVTDAPDDASLPFPDTSCVLGDLPEPGSWDATYARKVYRKYSGKHR